MTVETNVELQREKALVARANIIFSQQSPFTAEDIVKLLQESPYRNILEAQYGIEDYLHTLASIDYLSYDYGRYQVLRL